MGNGPLTGLDPDGREDIHILVNLTGANPSTKQFYYKKLDNLENEVTSQGFSVKLEKTATRGDFVDALNDFGAKAAFVVAHGNQSLGQLTLVNGFIDTRHINSFEYDGGFSALNTDLEVYLYACYLGKKEGDWKRKLPNLHAPFKNETSGMKAFDKLILDVRSVVKSEIAKREADPTNEILKRLQ